MTRSIRVDPDAATPPYEQIRAYYAATISGGDLTPGTRLPTVRRLAEDLGLAVNTVARAYRELEADGLVVTRGRAGTLVASPADERSLAEATTHAGVYLDQVRRLGISVDEAVALLRQAARPT